MHALTRFIGMDILASLSWLRRWIGSSTSGKSSMIAGSEVATVMEGLRPLTQEQRQVCGARALHHAYQRVV
jgi:hypothetical protein